ncbi:TetR/AcrR family transcriptional regulator [Metabacillus litoralis]|uniref:TetR/AcrR family transcriptional regulator n=1 Tax=Metabacillus TaxID=2675233 RepID=UPI000EF603C7|nr:TetR/AcrR family transcriptional regulator [Metabacillus litoralis]MCM3160109.1 TetR/AcrR family transcriptional regulator [Metabacillus litoralis]MCM3408693.1 TetR/AcrR family transcriptional regulator [Metabacillus litoralis]UHA59648.1 TetR/AcrR family transcriptional regulator [Metabacillus litoralis]
MYSAFEKLPDEKREKILTICIEEFAKTGYEKTSTETITSRAGISKGILFHYFKSKKNLYLYVVDYCSQLIGGKIIEEIKKVKKNDFFERIKEVVLIKQRIQYDFLIETKLVTSATLHPPVELQEQLQNLLQKNTDQYSGEFLNKLVDKQLLQGRTSPEKIIELTLLALDSVSKKYVHLFESKQLEYDDILEKMMPELDEYIDIIKYGAYGNR